MKSLWIASAILAIGFAQTQAAVTVNLNNLDASTAVVVNSAGVDLDETYTFSLGAFLSGFTPTENNVSDWQANWVSLDNGINGDGWNTVSREVSLSGTIDPSNVSQFPEGTQLYLWVYNTQAIAAGTEWALITDTDIFNNNFGQPWTAPNVNGSNPDLYVVDADTVIYGGVNDVTSTGGTRTATPTDFQIQTHSVTVAPVPEPSSCLLVGLAGLALRMRRRRSA
jgi:hypothetical protein